jgi:hypothetical protein
MQFMLFPEDYVNVSCFKDLALQGKYRSIQTASIAATLQIAYDSPEASRRDSLTFTPGDRNVEIREFDGRSSQFDDRRETGGTRL